MYVHAQALKTFLFHSIYVRVMSQPADVISVSYRPEFIIPQYYPST